MRLWLVPLLLLLALLTVHTAECGDAFPAPVGTHGASADWAHAVFEHGPVCEGHVDEVAAAVTSVNNRSGSPAGTVPVVMILAITLVVLLSRAVVARDGPGAPGFPSSGRLRLLSLGIARI